VPSSVCGSARPRRSLIVFVAACGAEHGVGGDEKSIASGHPSPQRRFFRVRAPSSGVQPSRHTRCAAHLHLHWSPITPLVIPKTSLAIHEAPDPGHPLSGTPVELRPRNGSARCSGSGGCAPGGRASPVGSSRGPPPIADEGRAVGSTTERSVHFQGRRAVSVRTDLASPGFSPGLPIQPIPLQTTFNDLEG
jgi:hypothetical protein